MSCQHRNDCRDQIKNAVASIKHIVKLAMLAHGAGQTDRVIPYLKETDDFLRKIEGALEKCGDAKMKFGQLSQERLATCDEQLQQVMNEVIKIYNITILCGFRNEEAQNKAVADNATDKPWPTSKHNQDPSKAVDVAPWPIDWNDLPRFWFMGGIILGVAHGMGIQLRWGRDWDCDRDFRDQKLNDFPHFELMEV
ncbi:MAG: hypothetical protein V1897_16895 [Pseudomonadota bacterium]